MHYETNHIVREKYFRLFVVIELLQFRITNGKKGTVVHLLNK